MDDADAAVERVEQLVRRAQAGLPGKYSGSALVLRPSPLRLVPLIVVCLAAVSVSLIPDAPIVVRAVALAMLVPTLHLGLELCVHRVVVTSAAVTDATWRTTSTTDGTHESVTLLDAPGFGRLSWSQRQRPTSVVWTGVDGGEHRLSFQWFRPKDAYAIIAAVHALD